MILTQRFTTKRFSRDTKARHGTSKTLRLRPRQIKASVMRHETRIDTIHPRSREKRFPSNRHIASQKNSQAVLLSKVPIIIFPRRQSIDRTLLPTLETQLHRQTNTMNDQSETTANATEPKLCKMGCGFFVSLIPLAIFVVLKAEFVGIPWASAGRVWSSGAF